MLTGELLRTFRTLENVTQAALAERARVSPTAIAEFETGKRDIRVGTAAKLCVALGVGVTYVREGIKVEAPNV